MCLYPTSVVAAVNEREPHINSDTTGRPEADDQGDPFTGRECGRFPSGSVMRLEFNVDPANPARTIAQRAGAAAHLVLRDALVRAESRRFSQCLPAVHVRSP